MKKSILAVVALIAAFAVPVSFAASQDGHAGHDMKQHSEMKGATAHEEVVDGVKVSFTVQTMADAMKAMGMEMPKGVKETHHISIVFTDAKTGKTITEGEAKVKVQAPDKTAETKDLMAMHGHFGADFVLAKKGKYGIMAKFKVKDNKVRQVKFWYEQK